MFATKYFPQAFILVLLGLSFEALAQAPNVGENHPSSGQYSPVDEANWATSTWYRGPRFTTGGNFEIGLYSKHATKVLLEIYSSATTTDASYDYWLQKGSDNVWRGKVAGVPDGSFYAFRVWGPNWPYDSQWTRGNSLAGFLSDVDVNGNRFNPNKVLYDPYGRELSHDRNNPELTAAGESSSQFATGSSTYTNGLGQGAPRREVDTAHWAIKTIALMDDGVSFGTKPATPQEDAIIYEAPVVGLTQDASSTSLISLLGSHNYFGDVANVPDQYRGTYKGAGYMAKYLKGLGFNTIELLPIHEWNNSNGFGWGYVTYGFFAPDRQYAYDQSPGGPTREFKEMVKAFHDEGIEVYLDVVYNHTGEGGLWGGNTDTRELTSYAGIDNSEYYALSGSNKAQYWVSTGVGNNFNAAAGTVRDLIKDSLQYWIDEMGVDGFRFDLATVLGRDSEYGYGFNANAQLLQDISSIGSSTNTEMIAEAWDLGTYQVGNFPNGWGEWNGHYRDMVRKFIKGDGNKPSGAAYSFTDMFYGSATMFGNQGGPEKSVNFVTAHDGFTMMDLVSYNSKNNNQAFPWGPSGGGADNNDSWNSNGDHALRRRQLRNIWTILMFSRGVPMVVMGDEFSRSQNGNNNAYNLDSVAVWNNYNMAASDSPTTVIPGQANNYGTDSKADGWNNLFNFSSFVTHKRMNHLALRQPNYSGVTYTFRELDGTGTVDNNDKAIWVHIDGTGVGDDDFLLFLNAHYQDLNFTIPAPASGKKWVRIIDTADWAESYDNIWSLASGWSTTNGQSYGVKQRSIAVFEEIPL